MKLSSDNTTPYPSSEYNKNVKGTIPFYEFFHAETIDLVKTIKPEAKVWLDTGCGTGNLVNKAFPCFPHTLFILADPSEGMLLQARNRLKQIAIPPEHKLSEHELPEHTLSEHTPSKHTPSEHTPSEHTPSEHAPSEHAPSEHVLPEHLLSGRIQFLDPACTEDLPKDLPNIINQPDVISAIQCHHYLRPEQRRSATQVCFNLLAAGGVYITFENIRPDSDQGVSISRERWKRFQMSQGMTRELIEVHSKRFNSEYFPITINEHLSLLKECGFHIAELFWYSYMQAGFYAIK